ncbi:MAG: hypothetical protein ACREJS_06340 [Candidatus Rokuibacteriota bacterium]
MHTTGFGALLDGTGFRAAALVEPQCGAGTVCWDTAGRVREGLVCA